MKIKVNKIEGEQGSISIDRNLKLLMYGINELGESTKISGKMYTLDFVPNGDDTFTLYGQMMRDVDIKII